MKTTMQRQWKRRRHDAGDTLIEVLITIIILSVTGLALLEAFTATISGSAQHRSLSANDSVLRAAAESAFSMIEQQASPLYKVCPSPDGPTYYNSNAGTPAYGAPTGYSATITSVRYWLSDGWKTTEPTDCTTPIPQQITLQVTNANGTTDQTSFVVNNLNASLTSDYSVTISSATPSQVVENASAAPIVISGSGFAFGAAVTFPDSNGDIYAASTVVVNSTTIDVEVTTNLNTPVGKYSVTVTNPSNAGGRSDTYNNLLQVTPQPTVISVSPNVLAQGGHESFTLSGTQFVTGMSVAVQNTLSPSSPSGVSQVGDVTVISPVLATVTLAATGSALTGPDSFIVTAGGGQSAPSAGVLTVTTPPTVTSAATGTSPSGPSPCNPGFQGTGYCVITGTNFQPGAYVELTTGGVPSISVGQVNSYTTNFVAGDTVFTQFTINISGTGTISQQTADITVVNPDGTTATLTNGFQNGP